MANVAGIGYTKRNSPIHRLTGAAKLIMVLLASIAAMITYDTRFLLLLIAGSVAMFIIGKAKISELRFIITLITVLMLVNNVMIYLFSPEEGVAIYGTRHVLFQFTPHYTVTAEQLFYQLNVTLKYFAVMPIALIFFSTTEPSEFASSLNKIGVGYKASYSVALALRYIPDVKRSYHEISQSQQARGIDMSKKAGLAQRVRHATAILFPLIFSSMDKIETISNAMELRSFGKEKRRSWFKAKPFRAADYGIIVGSALLVGVALVLNWVNGGRFYNPFL